MGSLADRVRDARVALGLSQSELAEAVTQLGFKIGQSGIGNIESGRSKRDLKCFPELAAALRVTVRWLRTGKGPRMAEDKPDRRTGYPLEPNDATLSQIVDAELTVPLPSQMPRDVPVLGRVSGGHGGSQMGEVPTDFVRRPPILQGRTDVSAFFVEDTAMAPKHENGSLIFVERRPPRLGDDAVVEYRPDGNGAPLRVLGTLTAITAVAYSLKQLTPPGVFDIARDHIITVWRVMTMLDLFGF